MAAKLALCRFSIICNGFPFLTPEQILSVNGFQNHKIPFIWQAKSKGQAKNKNKYINPLRHMFQLDC